MSFQASINQALSVAAMLTGMNPNLRAAAEHRQKVSKLSKQAETMEEAFKTYAEQGQAIPQALHDEYASIKNELFKISPSEETLKDYKEARVGTTEHMKETSRDAVLEDPEVIAQEIFEARQREKEINDLVAQYEAAAAKPASPAEAAATKAQEATQAAQNERRSGRRKFSDYLASEPTSLGGKVGDLPKEMQQEIAKQYTKSQRKALMDRKDLENVKK